MWPYESVVCWKDSRPLDPVWAVFMTHLVYLGGSAIVLVYLGETSQELKIGDTQPDLSVPLWDTATLLHKYTSYFDTLTLVHFFNFDTLRHKYTSYFYTLTLVHFSLLYTGTQVLFSQHFNTLIPQILKSTFPTSCILTLFLKESTITRWN